MSEIGRRLVSTGDGQVEVQTFDVDEPGPGEVLVRVNRSQVSGGTEKTGLLPRDDGSASRRTLGYIMAGRVLAAGPGMEEYRSGERVLAFGHHSSHWITGRPGDIRSDTVIAIHRIEHDITDEQAAFATLGDVAMHGVRRAELQVDESVAIFGQGVVGQMATAICRISGAYPVVAVDMDADRLALAKQSGATHTVDASKEDAAEAVHSITNGGANCTIHATRTAQTLLDCMRAASDRGKVVVIGLPPDTVEMNLVQELMNKELQIRGSNEALGLEDDLHPYWRWTRRRNRDTVMRMIASGELKVDHLISHVAKPEQANELYQKILAGPTGWMAVFLDWEDEAS